MASRRRNSGFQWVTIAGAELLTLFGLVIAAQPQLLNSFEATSDEPLRIEQRSIEPRIQEPREIGLILPPDTVFPGERMDRIAGKPTLPANYANSPPFYRSNYSY